MSELGRAIGIQPYVLIIALTLQLCSVNLSISD